MSHWMRALLILALAVATVPDSFLSAQLKSTPGDWPAWRGPDRNGLSRETGLLREWPAGGPKLLWKATGLGGGFSTPSVAGGRIYVMGAKDQAEGKGKTKGKGKAGPGSAESVLCLDARDGKPIWSTEIGALAGGHPGPRSTPTIDDDRVYAISSNGILACLGTGKGEVVWKRNLRSDFAGQSGGWAYTESPLVDGDTLICTPGGEAATLVALDKKTGKEIWRAPVKGLKAKRGSYNRAGYSSAIVVESGGVKQYVQFLSGGVVGIAAKDGKLLWHYDEPANGTANCSTPIFHDDSVFAASAYSTGGGRAKIVKAENGFKAEPVYFLNKLQNHHGGMVLVGEHVYGTGSGSLMCINFKDGKEAWSSRGAGKGSVAYADGHVYQRGEDGMVCLVEATPAGYKEKGRFKQPDRSSLRAWAHPVIAGGKLYLRDWNVLLCYDVKGN